MCYIQILSIYLLLCKGTEGSIWFYKQKPGWEFFWLLIFDKELKLQKSQMLFTLHYIQKGQQDGTGKKLNVLGKLMERLVKSSIIKG